MKSLFAVAFVWLVAGVLPASAQNLIYRIKIEPIRTMNLHFYNEGYFVCPVVGGEGTFIFAYRNNGVRSYNVVEEGGRLYFARKNDDIYSVVEASAVTRSEDPSVPTDGDDEDLVTSSSASFVCFGEATKSKGFKTALSDFRTRVAPKLNGGTVAWAEERAEGAEIPRHLGFAGVFDFFLKFEEGRTDDANHRNLTIDEIVDELTNQLRGQGYKDETVADDEPEPENGGNGGDGVTVTRP
ncbi:hypothetical protein [Sulfuriroseicoccus oceanibius]|uniref:Uncharacterized protein n=1 Tax=Sulfuriroseicoccus oceanibius TaxID=2707525 RepID=A0A6B3LAS1_9BACT|nr:hypothetical protein [Sulfuriroseicoccus oceanibius]QQL44356.1 hypothetical protein G3M56_010730 [Sulfuriroseicoccus oceanibius]